MKKYFYHIAISLILISGAVSFECQAARVQWFVEVLTDPVSKKAMIEARILTKDGYRLHIFKKNKRAKLWFCKRFIFMFIWIISFFN